jgi:hypothetical protein
MKNEPALSLGVSDACLARRKSVLEINERRDRLLKAVAKAIVRRRTMWQKIKYILCFIRDALF